MGKLKAIGKQVNLNEFRNRGCTACGTRLSVESINGRVYGRYGHASTKILSCDTCEIKLFYDWNYKENKYLLDHVCFEPSDGIDAFIDYSGDFFEKFSIGTKEERKKFNVVVRIFSNISRRKDIFIYKTYSLPKKKMLKEIKDKIEIYTVFA